MNEANLSQLTDVLIRAPVQFQGVNFDEDHAKAQEFARWLVSGFGTLLHSALSDTDCVSIKQALCGRASLTGDELEPQVTGSSLRGTLRNFAGMGE